MRARLTGVTKFHGAQVVLENASLDVGPRARIGLVGPNGVGKSTVLRLLAGEEAPDAGVVALDPPRATVAHLRQEPERRLGETLRGRLARLTGVAAAERELEAAAAAFARDADDARDSPQALSDRYDEALARFLALGGGDLDAAGLAQLEAFVDGFPGAVVLVSHDRAFLDRTVGRIAEIDPRSHGIVEWVGGWSDYARRRDEARHAAYAHYVHAGERRRELTTLLSTRRTEARAQGAGLGEKSGGADRRGTNALRTKVRQAEKLLERNPLPEKPFEPWELRLELHSSGRLPTPVARLVGAVVERGAFRLGPLDLELQPGERVALTGPNGSGKTTLVRALLGELELSRGTREMGRGVVVGVVGQARIGYAAAEPLLETFSDRTGLDPVDARTLLAKFGLGAAHVLRGGATLSPGERTRAHLAELQAAGVNLLVLDEPTNHLDLEAVEQLEQALAGWDGALVVVSHDRRFLEAVAPTRTVALP